MEWPPAQSACPCRSGTTTQSCSWLLPYSHLPLTGMLQQIAQTLLHGFSAELSARLMSQLLVYTDVVSHVAAISTQGGGGVWGRNSPSTQITDICSENVLLISNWSKAKRKFTLAASEQRICSDVSPHQVLSVDRINKVHCYEPRYRISML